MKKPSKKLIAVLTSVLVVVFFVGVIGAMAVAGRIDLSNVPVVGAAVETLAERLDSSEETETAVGSDSQQLSYSVATNVTPAEEYTSITDVAVSDGYIYAADKTGKKVYKLSADGKISATYNGSDTINGVCVNGSTVYVLEGNADGKLVILDSSLKSTGSIEVGHTPMAMAVKGSKAYVANRFDNSVSVVNLTTKKVTSTIAVDGREVIDMALAGDKLYVACHLADEAGTEAQIAANVAVIDTSSDKMTKSIELVNGADSVKGIAASPDGKKVYVSHVIGRYAYPTTQLDRGWINTNGFSVIDTASDTATAVLLDEVELGASNPWGLAVSEDGKSLIVAIAGTDEAMVVDIAKMDAKINAVAAGTGVVSSVERIADYLPFLDDCRTRVSLSGKGARPVAVSGNTAYIGQYFTGDIATVDLTSGETGTITFADQPENDQVRTGEILFADATQCYQQWESCLSCHPEGEAGGFNWMEDVEGSPKSTKSLMYSHRTPPILITASNTNAEKGVRDSIHSLYYNGRLDEDSMVCIDEYLKSLQPVQSPYLNTDGTLTESAERGKALFESQGCTECHPAPLYTDMKLHNVGTSSTVNGGMFDTPSLVSVWRTGPWLHDGRTTDMKAVVKQFAKGLSDSEITDLANFVLSIGDEGEDYGVEEVVVNSGSGTVISELVPGGEITSLTIRRQQEDSAASAIATVTLKDKNGKVIKTSNKSVSGLAFNTAKEITLSGFVIPEDAEGVALTVSIKNTSGVAIASDYVLKY